MTTILNFKDIVDLPKWRILAPGINNSTAGVPFICDLRNNDDRHPIIYHMHSSGSNGADGYNVKNDEWIGPLNFSIGATFPAAGTGGIMMPSQGPRGVLDAGSTATDVVISTALPVSVGINQLANRGDGRGFKIRIIGNASAGSSGKTEERIIIGNTGGAGGAGTTTPTLTLESPLSFTPATGDAYEILSGRVFIRSTTAFRAYDIATNTTVGFSAVGAPSVSTEFAAVGLDEGYVPYNKSPGEGFLGILTATASGATSLTGQTSGGDAGVAADEYRNFQIRIVQDTGTPLATGQRRNITTHTGPGLNPVYTVPAWTTQPSATAQYVIENNGDRILEWSGISSSTFTFNILSNTWDTTTFDTRGSPIAVGSMAVQSFGIVPDQDKNARTSYIYSWDGNNSSSIRVLDIAAATTGVWNAVTVYGNSGTLFSTSANGIYEPVTNQGRYFYIQVNNTQRMLRLDLKNRILEQNTYLRFGQPGVVFGGCGVGQRMASFHFGDGNTKIAFIMLIRCGDTYMFGLPIIS